MVFIGVDAINRVVNETGLKLVITHFNGTPRYDAEQNLINPNETVKATGLRGKPSKRDVEQTGNNSKISYEDYKFRLINNVCVDIGDEVKLECEDTKYYIVGFNETRPGIKTSNIIFISTSR